MHQKFREAFIEEGKSFHETQIIAFSKILYVSLTLDAGTLIYGHFLDYCISTSFYDIKPYLYDADFQCNNSSEYIKSKTEQIILELHDQNVNVATITGDNHPAPNRFSLEYHFLAE